MQRPAIQRFFAVWPAAALLCAGLLGPAAGWAQSGEAQPPRSRSERISELERQVEVLAKELDQLRVNVAVPETKDLVSRYGLGPAASKIYGVERGLSIGGYGEAYYTSFQGKPEKQDISDFLRFVTYIGYKFSDRIVMNSEIEFEHASTSDTGGGSGSVSVEFATLEFFWRDEINFRAGMVLLPMGFVNEIHEPPYFHGVQRPEVERRILPSTWRENGAGVFGEFAGNVSWRAYVVTSLDGGNFSDSGIRGGRQKGNRAKAEDLALVLRADWEPEFAPGLLLGGSFFTGGVDHSQTLANGNKLPDARLRLWEVHAQYRRGPFHARALYASSDLGNALEFNRAHGRNSDEFNRARGRDLDPPIAEGTLGYYLEAAWDFLPGPRKLAPFLRYELVNTQDEVPAGYTARLSRDRTVQTLGVAFHPHPDVAIQLEYRSLDPRKDAGGDITDELSIGIGFAF